MFNDTETEGRFKAVIRTLAMLCPSKDEVVQAALRLIVATAAYILAYVAWQTLA